MMKSKYLREIILKSLTINIKSKLCIADLENISFEEIRTQGKVEDGGNADIRIESNSCFFLIENKINPATPLQPYQTTTYPKEVTNKKIKNKALIFIIPKTYHVEKNKILELCNNSTSACITSVIYWDEFLNTLESYDVSNDNPNMASFIGYLRDRLNITNQAFFTRKDFLTMLNPSTLSDSLSFYYKFRRLLKKTEQIILNSKNNLFPGDFTGTEKDETISNIGKYLRTNEEDFAFWFGYNMQSHFGSNIFFCINYSLFQKANDLIESDDTSFIKVSKTGTYFIPTEDEENIYFPLDSNFLSEENIDINANLLAQAILNIIERHTDI